MPVATVEIEHDGADEALPNKETAMANAALISASPKLYHSLEEIVEATEKWNAAVEIIIGKQPDTGIGLDAARAALKKANGK